MSSWSSVVPNVRAVAEGWVDGGCEFVLRLFGAGPSIVRAPLVIQLEIAVVLSSSSILRHCCSDLYTSECSQRPG